MSALGISAVLLGCGHTDSAVLDLAAVLHGLVGDRFEIVLITSDGAGTDELRARGVPLRLIRGASLVDGCAAAKFELILIAAEDGQFDVRELNHVLEAIEAGADLAVGYRPHATDPLIRAIQRCGWMIEVDCAFTLMRRAVWQRVRGSSCSAARRLGYRVSEVPVRRRRPTIGAPVAA